MDIPRIILDVFLAGLTGYSIYKKKKMSRDLNQIIADRKESEKKVIEGLKQFGTKITLNKDKIRVLFIDDEDYGIASQLKERGKTVFFYGKNIEVEYIEQCEPFDIIYVDYKGVATKLFSDQGFSYACEIKKRYPEKIVILYSVGGISGKTPTSTSNVQELDDFISKHNDIDLWVKEIEHRERTLRSSSFIFNAFDKKMNSFDIEQVKAKKIKDCFRDVVYSKSLDTLALKLIDLIDDRNDIYNIYESAIKLIKLVGNENE